jgi:osmotically-inducible protein OsmY
VSKGRVTLTGAVPSERMRDSAVAAASSVVADVVDARLQVTGATARASRVTPKAARRRTPPKRKRGGQR